MVSAPALAGLALVVALHTLVAALLTRFFRVRLRTRWGSILYTLLLVPLVLLVSTMVVSGVLSLGPNLGGTGTAVFVMIGVPFAIGVTIDYIWMPHPDDVQLPDTVD